MHRRNTADTIGDEGAPALRDAARILARAEADEAEANEARERYRSQALPVLEPEERIARILAPDEKVVAVRRSVMLERRQLSLGSDAPTGVGGDLYLTTRRLVLASRPTLAFELDAIEESMLSGERLALLMRDGQGVLLDVDRPRLLRVEIAAARTAAMR